MLILRLMVEAESASVAAMLAADIEARLAALVPHQPVVPEQYWKMPELYELTFHLRQDDTAFDAVVALAAAGWLHMGDEYERSSVWNRGPGSPLLRPEVRWAELIRPAGRD